MASKTCNRCGALKDDHIYYPDRGGLICPTFDAWGEQGFFTEKSKGIRSIPIIGGLWPLCKTCKHIAQEHDEGRCGFHGTGQCKECGQWGAKIQCSCTKYDGPTFEEFKRDYLTPEEIAHYKW